MRLKYEQDAYEDLLKDTPKLESLVETPDGVGVVNQVQLLREQVKVVLDQDPDTPKLYHKSDIDVIRNGKGKRPPGYEFPVQPPERPLRPVWFRSHGSPLPPFRSRSVRSGGKTAPATAAAGAAEEARDSEGTAGGTAGPGYGGAEARRKETGQPFPAGIPADRPTLLQRERVEPDRGSTAAAAVPTAAAITGPEAMAGRAVRLRQRNSRKRGILYVH